LNNKTARMRCSALRMARCAPRCRVANWRRRGVGRRRGCWARCGRWSRLRRWGRRRSRSWRWRRAAHAQIHYATRAFQSPPATRPHKLHERAWAVCMCGFAAFPSYSHTQLPKLGAHLGEGSRVGDGVGSGVAEGAGLAVGDGVGSGVGGGVGAAVGDGVGLRTHKSSA
jgi:hypothetical protein